MREQFPNLQPEGKDNNLPFEIKTLQWISRNPESQQSIPHRHDHVEIIWMKTGTGSLQLESIVHEMRGNMLYCIGPGQIHRLSVGEHSEGYIICFTESVLNLAEDDFDLVYRSGLFQMFTRGPIVSLSEEIAGEMQEIAEKMMKEFDNFYLLRTEMLQRYVKIFLIYLTRQVDGRFQAGMQTRNAELLKSFISLIEKNYRITKMVKDYALQLSVTPNYLNEIVKKTSGYPAGHHIRQRVVLEAKRQATYTDVTMKEIAYYLGFDDIAHFSKFFKTVSGKSFTDFKKQRTLQPVSPEA